MQVLKEAIVSIIKELGLPEVRFVIEHPKDEKNGDYACNVALLLFRASDDQSVRALERQVVSKSDDQSVRASDGQSTSKSGGPRALAEEIVELIRKQETLMRDIVEKIEVAVPGFINFYLKKEWLWATVHQVNVSGEKYGENTALAFKKVMVEYTDPNPFKEMHIGHLMSNTIGEAIARLKIAEGAEVKRANYQGDIGLHVGKSIWGMRVGLSDYQQVSKPADQWTSGLSEQQKIMENLQKLGQESVVVKQKFMGQSYAYGATKYEEDESAKAEMHVLNKIIYNGSDPFIMDLYVKGREWSLEYFETIYNRLGTKFDEYFFESEAGPVGLKVVEEGLKVGVLEVGEGGAVVYKGEKDHLHTRVFRNKLGLPTYEAKDLGLAKTKYGRYRYDQSIIVTANEITEYFKVLLVVMEQLYPDLRAKTVHKPHGIMKLPTGKMSSRTGKVVTAESLLDELKKVVLDKMGDPTSPKASKGHRRDIVDIDKVADSIAVGALKYTVLKQAIGGDIVYDPVTMTNMEGDTGPYIQYTHARIMSILRKAKDQGIRWSEHQIVRASDCQFNAEELGVLRHIYRFPEVVAVAASEFAPHYICTYLYELASRYNKLYNSHRIADAQEGVREQRLELSSAVGRIVKNGLQLLGIVAPEEM